MGYKVGISTGFWYIGKDPNLLGLAQKAGGLGATGGITFVQIDLETMSEFLEPKLKENMKRMQKDLGMEIGIHAEIGELSSLEGAQRRIWEQAHLRLCEIVKKSADLGFKYINMHTSSTVQLYVQEAQLRPFGHQYQVVSPDGKPLSSLCDSSPAAKNYALQKYVRIEYADHDIIEQEQRKLKKQAEENFKKERDDAYRAIDEEVRSGRMGRETGDRLKAETFDRLQERWSRWISEELHRPERVYEMWKKSPMGQYFVYAGEIGAYMIVAEHMRRTGEGLWNSIAKGKDPEEVYNNDQFAFNAAVAAYYIDGHLKIKDHPFNKQLLDGKSIVEFLQGKELKLLFENPEAERGQEGLYRLYHPDHMYHLVKKVNSPAVRLTLDFEHMLAHKVDPEKELPKLPGDFGKYVELFHLGEPKPYWGTAHIPIPLGSQAQEILYKWIYELRRKGFEDGIMIFERGGGRAGQGRSPFEVFEHSVWVLRQIAKFLEKDTKPDDLPPEFFGMSFDNKDVWARQLVTMREHAWDPLHDVLSVPEEKHTFLSRAAVEKGKAQEWEKRKFR